MNKLKKIMTYILVISLLLSLQVSALSSQAFEDNPAASNEKITFKDSVLERVLRGFIKKPNGDVYKSDLASIKDLELFSMGVKDISDLKNLSSLTNLYVYDEPITDINVLKDIPSLRYLYLYNIELKDTNAFSSLSNLQSLYLSNCQVDNYSFLEKMNNLNSLSLSNPQMSDIGFLSKMHTLKYLRLDNIPAKNLSIVGDITGLESLFLINTNLSDVKVLSKLTNLKVLGLSGLELKNFDFLKNYPKLEGLTLNSANIQKIDEISKLVSLKELQLSSNNISNLKPLEKLSSLEFLRLSDNEISNITPLGKLAKLKGLYLRGNKIKDINALENLTQLETLDLSANEIVDITALNKHINLKRLYINANKIRSIDCLEKMALLESLYLNSNEIENIKPLSKLVNLKVVDFSKNKISDISPLKNLNLLETLYLFGNNISDITALKNLTNLTTLFLYSNNITDISALENMPYLEFLWLSENPITDYSPVAAYYNRLRNKDFKPLFSFYTVLNEENAVVLESNNKVLELNTPVSIESFAKAIGAKYEHNATSKTVKLTYKSKVIELKTDSNTVTIDGNLADIGVTPSIAYNIPLLPLSSMQKLFGVEVKYDNYFKAYCLYTKALPKLAPFKVTLNGKVVVLSTMPVIQSNKALVPLDTIFKAFGAKYNYNSKTGAITGNRGKTNITLKIKSTKATAGSKEYKLEAPVTLIKKKPYGPIKSLVQLFGAKVNYVDKTKTYDIKASDIPKGPVRIYFMGTSYTVEVPDMLQMVAKCKGKKIETDYCSVHGGLKPFWDGKSKEIIEKGVWDYVVIQNLTTPSNENFKLFSRLFNRLNSSIGAKTMFYLSWYPKLNNNTLDYEGQNDLNTAYNNIASELGSLLAPAGPAWMRSYELKPDLNLYVNDNVHANSLGTYLTACVIYATIFKESPEGTSNKFKQYGIKPGFDLKTAKYLEKIAWETVKNYKY